MTTKKQTRHDSIQWLLALFFQLPFKETIATCFLITYSINGKQSVSKASFHWQYLQHSHATKMKGVPLKCLCFLCETRFGDYMARSIQTHFLKWQCTKVQSEYHCFLLDSRSESKLMPRFTYL